MRTREASTLTYEESSRAQEEPVGAAMSRVLSGPVSVVDHSRRRFLTAAGGGVLLAACGGGSAHSASGASSGGGAAFSVLPNTFDFIAGVDQRVAIALADSSGNPITPDAPVTLRIGAPGAALGAEIPMAMHNQGVPAYLLTSYLSLIHI